MAEVQALGTGRQIRIDIWTVFNYNLTENKAQCTAITGEKPCGFKIDGKNTTRGTSVNFVDENYDEKYSLTTFFP